jgi:pimeloyl-ACP methyl ester carboxylesterase
VDATDRRPHSPPEDLWAPSRSTSVRMAAYDGPGRGGPSLVAVHGLGTSVDLLREVLPGFDPFARLAAEGFNVLALDLPGHGRSGNRPGHLSYREAMEAIATAASTARERWDGPVGLFGTALGGVLSFYAALEGDGIGAVVCHNVLDLRDVRPVLQRTRQGVLLPVAARVRRLLPPDRQERVPIPARLVAAGRDAADDPVLARALRRHPQAVRRYDLAGLGSILLSPEDKPSVSAQRVPTMVAVGGQDRVLPETTTRAFVAQLSCPNELWVLPGGSHQLLLEHPEALVPVAGAFLHSHLG